MKKELRFRVKYGFNNLDKISIDETELEKALYAQKFGEVVQLRNKQINGKYIIDISPDVHYYTEWFDTYEPTTGDDIKQIERDCPPELNDVIRQYRERVDYLIYTNRRNLIGKNVAIPELDKPKDEVKQLPPDIKKLSDDIANNFKI